MDLIPEIKLLKGFCTLSFGETRDSVKKLFGDPEEIQDLKDDIFNTSSLVYHYWEKGFSLFFDNQKSQVFSSAEIDNRETLMFGVRIFTLKEKEMIELMKANGFALSESEVHEWGEKRLGFDEAGLDCYFENNRLVSVNFSMPDEAAPYLYFPN